MQEGLASPRPIAALERRMRLVGFDPLNQRVGICRIEASMRLLGPASAFYRSGHYIPHQSFAFY